MDQQQRTLRVGVTVILCAAVFRLSLTELPGRLWETLTGPEAAAFLKYPKTGRDVRFSSSVEVFSPDFVETPPPWRPQPEEEPLPSFSDPEAVELYYGSRVDPDIAALLTRPLTWNLYGEEPAVLILHTHTTESYTKQGEKYQETALWRTLDENYNMLAIGRQVAAYLEEAGIGVLHDRTVHDYPSYNGSYADARETVARCLQEYPSVQLVLDLHRDASGGQGGQLRPLACTEPEPTAQLMVVLGTGHSGYEENLSLGLKIHAQLEKQLPGITRPLQLRAQRFNQDLLPGMLLVEVGAAGNSHAEAAAAAKQLAVAVAALAKGTQ